MLLFFLTTFTIIVIIAWTYYMIKFLHLKKECTEKTTGVIKKVHTKYIDSGDDGHFAHFYDIEYQINGGIGTKISKESVSTSNIKNFKEGDEVEIFYNPSNVDCFYFKGDFKYKVLSFCFFIFILISLWTGFWNDLFDDSTLEITQSSTQKSLVTKELAYEGVDNYCHSVYDWSVTEDNPSIMYVEMGEESDTEYKIIFRSYTGAFVYFYVDKLTGNTKMVEHVPTLDIENEIGTINIYDYVAKDD